jgi:SseB protein N-terminal domain
VSGTTDSGGIPWLGRDLPSAPFASDDSRPDPTLVSALAVAADRIRSVAVAQALGAARVFVAVVARPDAATEMALVLLDRPDGRRALPVFTSPDRLTDWRPAARPVPVVGRQAALSAVAEGCELMLLDPGTPSAQLVPRPAVWAVAQDHPWLPSHANPVVVQEISHVLTGLDLVGRCEPGESAELRIVLALPVGLDARQVSELTARLAGRLGESEVVAQGVDSLEIVVLPL